MNKWLDKYRGAAHKIIHNTIYEQNKLFITSLKSRRKKSGYLLVMDILIKLNISVKGKF